MSSVKHRARHNWNLNGLKTYLNRKKFVETVYFARVIRGLEKIASRYLSEEIEIYSLREMHRTLLFASPTPADTIVALGHCRLCSARSRGSVRVALSGPSRKAWKS